MKINILDLIDFEKVDTLLEGFNKTTGFVTAILDLEGKVLSKSGWRQMCTDFHRINPKTSKKCIVSDTELAWKLAEGEKYHFYKCLNGLVDVALPIIINGEHIANLFSGQFFFEEPDRMFFKKQARKYGFNEESYLEALGKVPVVSKEKVLVAMDFLLNMTQLIIETIIQKLEQTELNNKLIESERHLRNTQKISHVGSWNLNVATNQVIWTDELYNMYGFDPALPPPPYTEHMKLFTPESWKMLSASLANTKETGIPFELELQTVKKNGSNGWMWVRGEAVKDLAGNTIGLWGAAQDITKRKESELEREHLLASEKAALAEAIKTREQLSQILERISDGFGSLDRNWCYTFVNERLAQTVERRREDLVGRNIWMEFPEAVGTPVHQAYIRAMTDQVTIDLEHYYTPFGRWFQHRFYPSPEGLSVFSKDITERKKTEEALRESEIYNRMLFELSQVGLALSSMDGKLVDINLAFASIIGRTIEETKQLTYWEITPEKYTLQEQEQLESLEKTGFYGPYEKEYIHKKGHLVPVRLQGLIFIRNNKKFIWSSIEDISERKRFEDELISKKLKIEESNRITSDLLIKLNEAQKTAKIGSWELDLLSGKVWWSDELYRIFELDPDNYIPSAESNAKYVHPDDNIPYHTEVQRVIESKGELNYDLRIITPNNNLKYCNSRAKLQFDTQGRPIRFQGTFADISERKVAENALRKSEERFRVAQDFSPDGFTILHPLRNEKNEIIDFIWVYENQTIARINRTKPEDVIGKHLLDVFPTHKDTSLFETYIYVANSGKPKILQEVNVGEVVSVSTWLRLVVVPMENDIAILAQDITERKRAEEEQTRLLNIIERSRNEIYVFDEDTLKFEFVNQGALENLGYSKNEMENMTPLNIKPEFTEKSFREILKSLKYGSKERLVLETMHQRKNGSTYPVEIFLQLQRVKDIKVFLAVINDITERKQKELEINKLNHRLEILIESIQQLSSAQSLDAVQDLVAKSARRLIGADGATLVFRDDDHCSYVDEDAIQPLWKGKKFSMHSCISGWVMENKKPVAIEDVFSDDRIPKDVYKPTFVKSLAMVPINVGEPIGAIGNYWKEKYTPTETEMQLLQTLADAAARAIENIRLYQELEERIKRRTEQLQAVNKELETFTYSVSHDLKAPLRGIDGYSKLLLDLYKQNLNEEAQSFIETIRSSTLQMNQLIDDLLDYSRLERSQLSIEHIKIKDLLKSVLSIYNADFKAGNFKININIEDAEIIADLKGLTIALRNLLENAIKFTKGKVEPSIQIEVKEKDLSWIISVNDNGIGFDMQYHQKIFDIFQRLQRVEDFPGTGIGLAMVSKAMHRMHGKVWAESTPGIGSTFYLEIPKNQ
ncbi:MAG: PAS domain S-box protein [Bacteroidales bacterium]|nr:PAS domain S-box protein [Bacteroidales bacterium]